MLRLIDCFTIIVPFYLIQLVFTDRKTLLALFWQFFINFLGWKSIYVLIIFVSNAVHLKIFCKFISSKCMFQLIRFFLIRFHPIFEIQWIFIIMDGLLIFKEIISYSIFKYKSSINMLRISHLFLLISLSLTYKFLQS